MTKMPTQADFEMATIKGQKGAIRKLKGGDIIEQYMNSTNLTFLTSQKYINVMKIIAEHDEAPLFYKINAYLRLQGRLRGHVDSATKRRYLGEAQNLVNEARAVYVHDPEDAAELNNFQAWIEHGSMMCDLSERIGG